MPDAVELPAVRFLLDQQHGLITRRQLLESGVHPRDLDRQVRRGRWRVVRRGVYARPEQWRLLDLRARRIVMAHAAARSVRGDFVVSHHTAAAVRALPVLEPPNELVHLTRAGTSRAHVQAGIKHHQAPYVPEQVDLVNGLPVFDVARIAVDIARENGFVQGVVACDAARQAGVTLEDLWAAVAAMRHWPEVIRARESIEFSDPGAESILESLGRILLAEIGIGPVETQFELRDATGWARCDMRVGRHIVECDGKVKLTPVAEGGLSTDPQQTLWDEKRRQDWVCGFRLGMSRLTWADCFGERRELAKLRVRREYERTLELYGSDISDLEHFVVRRRAT